MLLRLDAQFFHLFTGLQDYEENLICMNMTKIQPSFFFFFFFFFFLPLLAKLKYRLVPT